MPLKKKLVTILAHFLLMEISAAALFVVAGSLAYYAEVYRKLSVARVVSFHIAELILIFAVQVLLVSFTFLRWYRATRQPSADLGQLLVEDEHEQLEFKTTFRWDVREQKVNKQLEKSVMKTVAAFLNSRGGTLVIGVDDRRTVAGLAADFATLNKPSGDGFENHFSNIFNAMIGAEFRQYARLTHASADGKPCCVVQVAPAAKPAYLKADDTEEFYIRTGNGTTALKLSEAAAYMESRFKKRG